MDKKYYCGICNKSYDNIEDRMACEHKCYTERKAAEEEKKKRELEVAKQERKAKVDAAYRNYLELRSEYVKDYGHYTYSFIHSNSNESNAWEDFWRNW